jgi:hypothetical protein
VGFQGATPLGGFQGEALTFLGASAGQALPVLLHYRHAPPDP